MSWNKPFACGTVTINATPAEVYRLISDPVAMVRFTEETYAIRWLDGTTRAEVSARFLGMNRNGRRRWTTMCQITDAEPGQRFAYDVSAPLRVPISRWQYDIEPVAEGCRVTETNWLRAPIWFVPLAIMITGVLNRAEANNAHIVTTLRRLKEDIEARRT